MTYEAASYIEIFSANYPLFRHITDDIEIGNCEGCSQTVYDVNNITEGIKVKMKDYGVKAVPTTIIDGKNQNCRDSQLSLDMWRILV